ncbi:hypothetical protein FACS189454_02360 [Planctomycetales bacterium]|nr:hypothetical protein FACS189454_02360 [Planctomycetales bacterium]
MAVQFRRSLYMKHIALLLLFAVLCLGCSQNVHVSGTVTYEDGSPVKSGTVKFETAAYQFNGSIRDGVYNAGVTEGGQGIPPGTYKVWLANTARIETIITPSGRLSATGEKIAIPQLTEEFTQPGKSPLSLEVKRGSGRIAYDIVVKQHPDWDKPQKYKLKEGGAVKTRRKAEIEHP